MAKCIVGHVRIGGIYAVGWMTDWILESMHRSFVDEIC